MKVFSTSTYSHSTIAGRPLPIHELDLYARGETKLDPPHLDVLSTAR
jgi:hypothetical protein